jgi:FtsP/CotA-like multicopper oxidase with cupredoxin domain
MSSFNRRQFLTLAAGSAALTLLTQCNRNLFENSSSSAESLPTLYQSQDGLLEVNLTAANTSVQMNGKKVQVLSYNGQIPGPRLEAKVGDTIRIHFQNRLDRATNLHYHGLHIPPTGNADNIFLHFEPGEQFTYEFTLPQDHPVGTFWYHPHHHGLVAEQVFGGLAGLLIVRGEVDEIPEIKAAKEEFLVLQDFEFNRNGSIATPNPMSMMTGREGSVLAVNGQVKPRFSLPQNGLLRLRIVNASAARFWRLQLEDHPFYLIGTDGGAIASPVELDELLLVPGERADILIKGDREPGEYRLLNLPYNRGGMMGRGGMMRGNTNNNPQAIATINYSEAGTSLSLPQTLVTPETLPNPQTARRFEINHGMMPGQGMIFLINGKPFQSDRIDTAVSLNTVEDWEILNTGVMDHPFHLHINDFQVISRNNRPEPFTTWKDTILVRTGESVRLRVPFRDFPGKTVYHCHILDHEDLGMMGNLSIEA